MTKSLQYGFLAYPYQKMSWDVAVGYWLYVMRLFTNKFFGPNELKKTLLSLD